MTNIKISRVSVTKDHLGRPDYYIFPVRFYYDVKNLHSDGHVISFLCSVGYQSVAIADNPIIERVD